MHEVLVNRLGGRLRLSRKSVVRLTDLPDMTLDVYRGRKTTMQQVNDLLGGNKMLPTPLVFQPDESICVSANTTTPAEVFLEEVTVQVGRIL